jgi:hypothetical protein
MSEEVFDFGQEEAWEPQDQILPPNWKGEVEVDDIEPGESSGGHAEVRIQLRATNGDGQIRDWIVITPGSIGHWLQVCEAFGVENPGQIATRDRDDPDHTTNQWGKAKFPGGKPTKAWQEHLVKFGGKRCHIKTYLDTEYDPQGKTKVQFYSNKPLFDGDQVPADREGLGNGQSQSGSKVPF